MIQSQSECNRRAQEMVSAHRRNARAVRRSVSVLGASTVFALAGCATAAQAPSTTAPAATAPSSLPPTAPAQGASAGDERPSIQFTDASVQSGLASIVTTSGEGQSKVVLEVKGCGLLTLDCDGDGHLDLFLPNGATLENIEKGPGARLLRNNGDGTFVDITATSGIAHTRWSYGGAVGDYDGDGRDDIYICCFGPDVLLRNLGDGRFEDVTATARVATPGWSAQAAFADLDGDGDLDLFVTRYLDFDPAKPMPSTRFKGIEVMSGPKGYPPLADFVYENMGDGTFADRSASSGIRDVKPAFGLAVVILDMNGDGKPDIFVGNDSMPNHLFVNQGGMKFTEEGMRRGIATNMEGSAQATMGTAVGDVDADGRPDLFRSVFSSDTNTLSVNSPGFFFDDRSNQYGVGAPSRALVGWASMFADLDHDGLEDLLVFNGHVYPQATKSTMDSEYEQPPLVMQRQARRFAVVDSGAAMRTSHRDRAGVMADFDSDGDLDVVVAGVNQPLRYLRNDHDGAKDWLIVALDDARPGSKNRRGLGSKIELVAPSGVRTRWLWSGGPFMSNWVPVAHFGIGADEGPFAVRVTWPDGTVQTRDGVTVGQRLTVTRTP